MLCNGGLRLRLTLRWAHNKTGASAPILHFGGWLRRSAPVSCDLGGFDRVFPVSVAQASWPQAWGLLLAYWQRGLGPVAVCRVLLRESEKSQGLGWSARKGGLYNQADYLPGARIIIHANNAWACQGLLDLRLGLCSRKHSNQRLGETYDQD